jgi:hypothetical protein
MNPIHFSECYEIISLWYQMREDNHEWRMGKNLEPGGDAIFSCMARNLLSATQKNTEKHQSG